MGFLNSAYSAEHWCDWQNEYQSICEQAKGQFCENLKNIDGSWVTPSESVSKILSELHPHIEKISKAFNISKETIIASILAENSLNVSLSDDIQSWLVKKNLLKEAKVPFVGYFTIGLSQVTVSAASKVEEEVAKIEKRKVRTQEQIAKELLNPESAITYTAAIIKQNQDVYKKYGFDISNRPDIMASLHSLGQPEKYALKAQQEKRLPKSNFMGIFACKYQDQIQIIAQSKKAVSPISPEPNSSEDPKKKLADFSINGLPLMSSVPLCLQVGAGKASDYNKNLTYFEGKVAGSLPAREKFSKSSETIDCNLKNWVLVKTQNGNEGWIQKEKLNSKLQLKLPANELKTCNMQQSCLSEIKKINGNILSSKGGRVSLKVAHLKEYGEPDITRYDAGECIAGWGRLAQPQNAPGNVDQKNIDELKNALDKFKSKAAETYKFPVNDWDNSKNPFQIVPIGSLEHNINEAQNCVNNKFKCEFAFDKYIKALKTFDMNSIDLNHLLSSASDFATIFPVLVLDANTSGGAIQQMPPEAEENLNLLVKNCSIDSKYKKSKLFFEKITQLRKSYTSAFHDRFLLDTEKIKEKIDTCRFVNYLDKKVEAMPEHSKYCNATVSIPIKIESGMNGSSLNRRTIDVNLLNKILLSVKSKDDFLLAALEENYAEMGKMEFPQEVNCSYDPFKTAEMIKSISTLKCVDKIYISDLWVLKKVNNETSNVLYLPSGKGNDFEVTLKNECK